jgi:hypothetical protein
MGSVLLLGIVLVLWKKLNQTLIFISSLFKSKQPNKIELQQPVGQALGGGEGRGLCKPRHQMCTADDSMKSMNAFVHTYTRRRGR